MQVYQTTYWCYGYFILENSDFQYWHISLSLVKRLGVLGCPFLHSFYYPVPTEPDKLWDRSTLCILWTKSSKKTL